MNEEEYKALEKRFSELLTKEDKSPAEEVEMEEINKTMFMYLNPDVNPEDADDLSEDGFMDYLNSDPKV